jgi:hypothetical protein
LSTCSKECFSIRHYIIMEEMHWIIGQEGSYILPVEGKRGSWCSQRTY